MAAIYFTKWPQFLELMIISLLKVTRQGLVYIAHGVVVIVCFELDIFPGCAYISTLATPTD